MKQSSKAFLKSCFLCKQEERRHRYEIALKSEISAAVSSLIIMKGYSNNDIKDQKEQRASEMTKWKKKKRSGTDCRTKSNGKMRSGGVLQTNARF